MCEARTASRKTSQASAPFSRSLGRRLSRNTSFRDEYSCPLPPLSLFSSSVYAIFLHARRARTLERCGNGLRAWPATHHLQVKRACTVSNKRTKWARRLCASERATNTHMQNVYTYVRLCTLHTSTTACVCVLCKVSRTRRAPPSSSAP